MERICICKRASSFCSFLPEFKKRTFLPYWEYGGPHLFRHCTWLGRSFCNFIRIWGYAFCSGWKPDPSVSAGWRDCKRFWCLLPALRKISSGLPDSWNSLRIPWWIRCRVTLHASSPCPNRWTSYCCRASSGWMEHLISEIPGRRPVRSRPSERTPSGQSLTSWRKYACCFYRTISNFSKNPPGKPSA